MAAQRERLNMKQRKRIVIIMLVLAGAAALLALYETAVQQRPAGLPLFVDQNAAADITRADLERLPAATFVEAEEGKQIQGWWLRDVIGQSVDAQLLAADTRITVDGVRKNGQKKEAVLTWAEVVNPDNHVALDPARDGQSYKLVSTLERLDSREEWIQGIRRITINRR
jgi:hypothetical protein